MLALSVCVTLLWATVREVRAENVRKHLPPLKLRELSIQTGLLIAVVVSAERLVSSSHDVAVIGRLLLPAELAARARMDVVVAGVAGAVLAVALARLAGRVRKAWRERRKIPKPAEVPT